METAFYGTTSGIRSQRNYRGRGSRKDEQHERKYYITLEEMENQIRRLKKIKAAGKDEIKNEAWLILHRESET